MAWLELHNGIVDGEVLLCKETLAAQQDDE